MMMMAPQVVGVLLKKPGQQASPAGGMAGLRQRMPAIDHQETKIKGSTKTTFKEARKRNLLNMLEDIGGIKSCMLDAEDSNVSTSQPLRCDDGTVRKSKKFKNVIGEVNEKIRIVRVNWKHRTSVLDKYKSRSCIKNQIKVELDYNKNYLYQDIKTIIIKAFVTPDVQRYFDNCDINLGLNNNRTLYSFFNEDGKDCGFWDFCKQFRDSGNRLTLNLLTTDYKENKEKSPKSAGEKDKSSMEKNCIVPGTPFKQLQNLQTEFRNESEIQVNINNASSSTTDVQFITSEVKDKIPEISIIKQSVYTQTSDRGSKVLESDSKKHSVHTQTEVSEAIFLTPAAPASKKKISYDAQTNIENLSLNIAIIDKEEIVLQGRIGEGAQGVLRLGCWCDTLVAVKMILRSRNEVNTLREIKLSEIVRHPSFILMMGLCVSSYDYYIIMEYFESSNLFDIVITKRSNIVLTMENKHKVASDLIAGLNFLHQQKNPIIHRDVKPNNILVNKNMQIKICDLGLSKKTVTETYLETSTDGRFKGTLLFMAPEIFINKEKPTVACDVWATGCTLIELYGGQSVWNFDLDSDIYFELYSKMSKKCIPQLEVIPSALREDIKECFCYDKINRIQISGLSSLYKRINQ